MCGHINIPIIAVSELARSRDPQKKDLEPHEPYELSKKSSLEVVSELGLALERNRNLTVTAARCSSDSH